MTATPPLVVVLDGHAGSKHLRIRGVVGGSSSFTDADLRAASSTDRRIIDELRRSRFVDIRQVGVGNLDKTYLIEFEVPSITTLPSITPKQPTVPPRARRKAASKWARQESPARP